MSAYEHDGYLVYDEKTGVPNAEIMDFSFLNEMPAGQHGAVKVNDDGNFEFEDETADTEFIPDDSAESGDEPDGPEGRGVPIVAIMCGAGAVLLIAAVGIIIVGKKRKAG